MDYKEVLMDNKNNQNQYLKDILINTLSSNDLDTAIKNIATELGKLFNADRVHFRFYDEFVENFSDVIEEYRKNKTIPSSKGKMVYPKEFDTYLKNKLNKDHNIFIIDDITKSGYPEVFKELFTNLNIKNEIVLPIFYNGKLESAFFITNTRSEKLLSEKNLDFLLPIAKQISIGTHLFKLNEDLTKTVKHEQILRDTIFKVRLYEDPEDVFRYVVDSLTDLYQVKRVFSLSVDSCGNYTVGYEALKNLKTKLKGEVIFKAESFTQMQDYREDSIIVVNDVNQIKNEKLKKYFKKYSIKAFMLYPVEELFPSPKKKKVEERIMVCSDIPRKWTYKDIEALKLIIGAITLIYIDIKNRKDIREMEETFIASLVHDLKSPLYAEQKAIEFILSNEPNAELKNFIPYLENMYNTNEELLRLIMNLLTVYSIEMGQHELKKESVNINNLINEATSSIKPLIEDHESKIIQNLSKNLEELLLDYYEIKRVFINLLSNALKHNPKGVEIKITTKKRNGKILVSISDNGTGIKEEEKSNIFKKYITTKRKTGSGLGLYLSKQIIEHHGGEIWFDSKEGEGTTFYFTLPYIL